MIETSDKFKIINDIVSTDDNVLEVSELCVIAGVSKSGYYNWVKSECNRIKKEEQDKQDFDLILSAYKHRGYDKGAKSIHMTLLHNDPPTIMNVKKISRLMKKYGLVCPIRRANPYRRMAAAIKTSNYADNLVERRFKDFGPRKILLTDITYIPYNSTFAYLSVITDAYTKQVLAYVLSDNLKVDFVLETLQILLDKYGDDIDEDTIIHSDQGCHYTSNSFIEIVKDAGIRQSMSRRGNCWDNAPQESFFGHMKDEVKNKVVMCTKFDEVKAIIDNWIDYYNNERYQWDLAKLSPNEYYKYITTGEYPLD